MMSLNNPALIYPVWAIVMVALSLILVQQKNYRFLLPHGIIGAYIAWVAITLASRVVNAWEYVQAGPFEVFGAPVFILLCWGATVIIFLWALPLNSPKWVQYLYIALFVPAGGAIDDVLHEANLRLYAPWFRGWMWMPVVFLILWINYFIYLKRIALDDEDSETE